MACGWQESAVDELVGEVRGLALALALLAIAAGTFNLVGGFAVTDRMLRFFRKREGPE